MTFTVTVNRHRRSFDADPETPLLWIIRDRFGLTGTKYGCGIGVCGACTVLQGQRAVRSCQVTAEQASGQSFTTIEGLAPRGRLHPCQQAWLDEEVAQCGFCQPGMILETAALLAANPHPNEPQIEAALGDHVCRCGTYPRILAAIRRASR